MGAIDNGSVLMRKELIKRYRLPHMLVPRRQEDPWAGAIVTAPRGEPCSVADVVRSVDLGVTRTASGLDSDVDLSATAFPFILEAMKRTAEAAGEMIYLLMNDGTWRDVSRVSFKAWMPKQNQSGYVELAIVDKDARLSERFSVTLWRRAGDTYEAIGRVAPIKKLLDADSVSGVRSDAFVEPIDAVYTWVNAEDPGWREMIAPYRAVSTVDHDRFTQVDELKYSIRSLFTFAPWIRKVFIFTNCAPPAWFKASDRVQWVAHHEVVPERYLPLFNSHAIETFLHEIPGLSERYVYFNDDVFLSAVVRPRDFFNAYGHSVSRMETCGVIEHLLQRVQTGTAEEWQHAAVNCARLMFETTGVLPSKLHCHTPHAYARSVYADMVKTFPEQLETTRKAQFRRKTDFSFSSFLYHHFALWHGRAAHIDESAMIVRATNYKRFLSRKMYSSLRFFCVNDGGGSSNDAAFRRFKQQFLNEHYTFKSPAEI
ncbi:hypothetical protein ATY31_06960 [Sinorhizobium americanum]|uniref:Stealth-like protein n=2 Tax=Sinorhizobium/Ensifer group TaxID=227292 RepID=A0A2S3YRF7_9HYPH|nr:hypothetical protein ATY31_06960 [Sinorhizobium americanum]